MSFLKYWRPKQKLFQYLHIGCTENRYEKFIRKYALRYNGEIKEIGVKYIKKQLCESIDKSVYSVLEC